MHTLSPATAAALSRVAATVPPPSVDERTTGTAAGLDATHPSTQAAASAENDGPTPGPWLRMEWSRHAATTLAVHDASVATGLRVVAEFETEADAALGQAAHDMAQALQALLAHRAVIELDGGHAAVALACAALAKATRGAHA